MASKELAELCRVVVSDVYGELAGTVLRVLFDHGRLTAQDICKRGGLPAPAVQRTLVALIQNRFVLYWGEPGQRAYYTANWREAYAVLWTGPILSMVHERLGQDGGRAGPGQDGEETGGNVAAEVVKNMHVYGHMKASSYLEAHEAVEGDAGARHEVARALTALLEQRLLAPLYDYDFNSPEDVLQRLRKKHVEALAADASAPTSISARTALAHKRADEEYEALVQKGSQPKAGLKPAADGGAAAAAAAKRRGGAMARGGLAEATKWTVDPDAVLRVNHGRFLVLARAEELATLARRRIGPVTAAVYRALLEASAAKVRECKQYVEPGAEFNVTTIEVARLLPPGLDLRAAIAGLAPRPKRGPTRPLGEDGGRKRLRLDANGSYVVDQDDDHNEYNNDYNDYNGYGSDHSPYSNGTNGTSNATAYDPDDVNRHLELLADCPFARFARKAGNKGGGEWFVPYRELVGDLQRAVYDDIVGRRCGPAAARALRIIREKGKVDEKMLWEMALLPTAAMRKVLGELQAMGAVDLQEVPRGNDRAASRSFFFWFHNSSRAHSLLLLDMYKSIARLYQRLLAERKHHSILLAKCEREDVKGHESELLADSELRELQRLRRREHMILVQIFRIDSLVRIFRDY